LTLFLVLFSGVLVQYGVATPSIANQLVGPVNCDVNNAPVATCQFPQYNPPIPTNVTTPTPSIAWWQCLVSTLCVIKTVIGSVGQATGTTGTAQSIWNGLSEIAYSLGYFMTFIYVFFNKLIQGIFLVNGITQIMSQNFSIPILQYFWIGLIVFYIMYGMSMLKPGGSGLP
jgi:hypothetical protein